MGLLFVFLFKAHGWTGCPKTTLIQGLGLLA